MGALVSRGYINSNYVLRPSGTADTDTTHIADCNWIEYNYFVTVSNYNPSRCPEAAEITPVALRTVTVYNTYSSLQNGWIIGDVQVNGVSLAGKSGFPVTRGQIGYGYTDVNGTNNTVTVIYNQVDSNDVGRIVANGNCQNINGTESSTSVTGVVITGNIDVYLDWDSQC
jgi:hypothetical protein